MVLLKGLYNNLRKSHTTLSQASVEYLLCNFLKKNTKLSYISNIFPFILLISNIKRFHIQKYKYSSNASLLSRRNLPYVAALLLSRQKCTICQPMCGRGRGSLPVVYRRRGERKKITHSESVSVCLDKPQLLIFAYEFMDVILVKITIIY